MTKKNLTTYEFVYLVSCLFIFLLFLVRGINQPFIGNNAWNFNTYSLIAHNYTAFGFVPTYFAPIVSVSEELPKYPEYYAHHPQLLSLSQAIVFLLFGESFVTARLPVIAATFFSAVLLYKIAAVLINKTYGLFCLGISILLPGFVIFGRMIGQEAFVLFFALLLWYACINYFKTKKYRYFLLGVLSVLLGTLSDWPMVYFTLAAAAVLYYKNEKKFAAILFCVSLFTAFTFFLYSVWLSGGISDLLQAFMVRSPGALLQTPGWLIGWPTTILLRIMIYFNPIIVLLAIVGFWILGKFQKEKTLFLTCLAFLCFGIFHILLYPEGSFGHAYWIYYLLVWIVFSSAYVLYLIRHKTKVILVIFGISLLFFVGVERWKFREAHANMFRYYFAQAVASEFDTYTSFFIYEQSVFDNDMFEYQFFLRPNTLTSDRIAEKNGLPIVYSCRIRCNSQQLSVFSDSGYSPVKKIFTHDAEVYIFKSSKIQTYSEVNLIYPSVAENPGLLSSMFTKIKTMLQFPQL